MIKAYIEGIIISVTDNSFKGTDGNQVTYYKNWVKVMGGGILTLPSTKDYSKMQDTDAVIEISVQEESEGRKTRYKLRIEEVRNA